MLHRTEAIVLKTMPFSEADLIVSLLTPDYGLMSVFAKSPRKIKSRFGSSLEPLTHSRIAFWGKEFASLPRLTQADIIRPFQAIRERMKSFLMVQEIIELTLNFLPEREAAHGIFSLLAGILDKIEADCAKNAPYPLEYRIIFYKIRFLDMAGYGPALDGCGRCGSTGYNFYISHGSIICGSCAKDTDRAIRLSPGTMELYKTMRVWDFSKIDRIRPSRVLFSEMSDMVDNHIQYHMARPLRTRDAIVV